MLDEAKYYKNMKKHFTKDLVMKDENENERHFRKAKTCHIWNELYLEKMME